MTVDRATEQLETIELERAAGLEQLRALHGRKRGAIGMEVELGKVEPLGLTTAEQEQLLRFIRQHGYRPKQQDLTAHAILECLEAWALRALLLVLGGMTLLFLIALAIALSDVPRWTP